MPKILFFAHDPGGANAINHLINIFKSKGHDVLVYARGPAINRLQDALFLNTDNLKTFLQEKNPDFIITGTSSNDFTEKYLWKDAQHINIPTMAILDHWCNYGIRFSKYGLRDIEKYNSDKSFDFLPSHICVMDDFAKSEMQNEGIPSNIIHPFGNPYFLEIKKRAESVITEKVRSKFIRNNNESLITFASEPYEEDYGISPERTALNDIYNCLRNIDIKTHLIIKLHPKESVDKYSSFYDDSSIDKETDSIELIAASDVVISMTSMFLVESVIIGKKCLSYQPNESDKNKFILTRNNVLPFIAKSCDLKEYLLPLLKQKNLLYCSETSFIASNDALVSFIEEKMCGS
ncbi:MAG: alpha-2,8-polysialyltransferase family protein [Holosporaceae bacterium]|jgi:hypothetical protein|nr:alpha-2,8-polysialyltransferase family protein [Holosporaceae bacterium]